MTYRKLSALPAFERAVYDNEARRFNPAAPGHLLWGSETAPPPVGAFIICRINNCGPAIVTGYFEEGGFLGLRCTLLAPPDWFMKQNKGDTTCGHVFGPEFRLPDAIAIEFKPTPRARKWRRATGTMRPEGGANMQETGAALASQEGWHAWRIVDAARAVGA